MEAPVRSPLQPPVPPFSALLPPGFWGLHSLYWADVRLLAAHIADPPPGSPDTAAALITPPDLRDVHYLYGRHPIHKVEVCGVVVEWFLRGAKRKVLLDDGTGIIQCGFYLRYPDGSETRFEQVDVGDAVVVTGKLHWGWRDGSLNETVREVQGSTIRKVVGPDELAAHAAATLRLHATVYCRELEAFLPANALAGTTFGAAAAAGSNGAQAGQASSAGSGGPGARLLGSDIRMGEPGAGLPASTAAVDEDALHALSAVLASLVSSRHPSAHSPSPDAAPRASPVAAQASIDDAAVMAAMEAGGWGEGAVAASISSTGDVASPEAGQHLLPHNFTALQAAALLRAAQPESWWPLCSGSTLPAPLQATGPGRGVAGPEAAAVLPLFVAAMRQLVLDGVIYEVAPPAGSSSAVQTGQSLYSLVSTQQLVAPAFCAMWRGSRAPPPLATAWAPLDRLPPPPSARAWCETACGGLAARALHTCPTAPCSLPSRRCCTRARWCASRVAYTHSATTVTWTPPCAHSRAREGRVDRAAAPLPWRQRRQRRLVLESPVEEPAAARVRPRGHALQPAPAPPPRLPPR
jgi:hypothetical protein